MPGETIQHRELKRLAVAWLRRLGCSAVAMEVRCPLSRWRVDVAGWFERPNDRPNPQGPLFEHDPEDRGTARGGARVRRGGGAWRRLEVRVRQRAGRQCVVEDCDV